jgi:hypothetical protein
LSIYSLKAVDGARTFKETASERGISDEEPGIAVVQRLSYNH